MNKILILRILLLLAITVNSQQPNIYNNNKYQVRCQITTFLAEITVLLDFDHKKITSSINTNVSKAAPKTFFGWMNLHPAVTGVPVTEALCQEIHG